MVTSRFEASFEAQHFKKMPRLTNFFIAKFKTGVLQYIRDKSS